MSKLAYLPLLLLLLSACSLLDGNQSDDPPCASSTPIDIRLRNAVPYQDGQSLVFEVSDGSILTGTVSVQSAEPDQIGGCVEETLFRFSSINVNNSLRVAIGLFGYTSTPEFGVDFGVNGHREHSLNVNLNAAGEVVSNAPSVRILPDTLLNDQVFTDVVVEEYSYLNNSPVRQAYYNVVSGFIGVELADGTTLFLQE